MNIVFLLVEFIVLALAGEDIGAAHNNDDVDSNPFRLTATAPEESSVTILRRPSQADYYMWLHGLWIDQLTGW